MICSFRDAGFTEFFYLYENISLWKEYVLTAELGSSDGQIRNSVLTSAGTITTTV